MRIKTPGWSVHCAQMEQGGRAEMYAPDQSIMLFNNVSMPACAALFRITPYTRTFMLPTDYMFLAADLASSPQLFFIRRPRAYNAHWSMPKASIVVVLWSTTSPGACWPGQDHPCLRVAVAKAVAVAFQSINALG